MKKYYQTPFEKKSVALALSLNERIIVAKRFLVFTMMFMFLLQLAFQVKGQSLTLLSPNGGETWMNGTTQTISWEWDGNPTDVYVFYSSDEGMNWEFVGNADESASSLEILTDLNVGEFTKIKVTSAMDAGISDVSDGYFTVVQNPAYFITPQAGEQFYPGQVVTLFWNAFSLSNCDIDISSDGGQSWTKIAENWPLDFYEWTIPDLNSEQCILKITDATDPTVYGLSPNFSILELPTATFTSPVGGDIWTYREDAVMSWTGTNLPEIVYFDYSVDGGQSWNYLGNANSGPSSGTTIIDVPKVSTTNAKIRMVNENYNLVIGITEDPFTIYVPPVIIFYPYDGQEFYINEPANIFWVVDDVDLVNVELSLDGGENWEMIETNLDADIYSFNWTVTGSPSDNCRIKISDASDPSKFDISGQFSILETPVITLTNPIGNELWRTDETYTISWSYDNPEVFWVNAEYSIDGGANWGYIGFGLPAEGSIEWKTPAIESEQCLIRVFDSNLPFISDTSELFAIRNFPYSPICIVSVDSTSNQNVIIWEKPATDQIRDYIVYKETNQTDVFEPIGTVAYDSLPFFVDINSNPAIKSYRYKLGFDDSEGYVYPMGDMHQTIHLTISKGVGNAWNLNWGAYLGFDVASYNIFRSTNGGSYELIETISSSFLSFTDIDAPAGDVYYFIEVEKENGCNLNTREYQVSSAISNIVTNTFLSVDNPDDRLISNVYPNPSSQWLNIVIEPTNDVTEIALFDLEGRMVLKENYQPQNGDNILQMNVSDIRDGIYFIKLYNQKTSQTQKVLIRH